MVLRRIIDSPNSAINPKFAGKTSGTEKKEQETIEPRDVAKNEATKTGKIKTKKAQQRRGGKVKMDTLPEDLAGIAIVTKSNQSVLSEMLKLRHKTSETPRHPIIWAQNSKKSPCYVSKIHRYDLSVTFTLDRRRGCESFI